VRDEIVVQCDEIVPGKLVASVPTCAAKHSGTSQAAPISESSIRLWIEREAAMSYHNPHRRAGLSGATTLVMLLVMLAAAASGALASRDDAGAFPAARSAFVERDSHWKPAQVRQLIAVIEESENNGFDPDRHGLAALRSELEQSSELWGRAGTHQLDVLARAAALSLANEYRGRAGQRAASADEVDSALASGELRSWLTLRAN
jgi:hypothetical protein